MSTLVASLSGIAVSLCMLGVLAWRDPMRLRVKSAHASAPTPQFSALSPGARRALSAIALAPGLTLIAFVGWAPFLIWFGALLIGGWALAGVMNYGRRSLHD